MIQALTVKLLRGAYALDEWEGVIEIDDSSSLEDIHFAIQHALDFDNDHLYGFFVARTERSRDRVHFDDENGKIYDTTIESLFPLPSKRHLYYLFDYGDHWLFKITKSKKKPQKPNPRFKYPRLTHETGTRPVQYPAWEE